MAHHRRYPTYLKLLLGCLLALGTALGAAQHGGSRTASPQVVAASHH